MRTEISLLNQASIEIKNLRRENQLMAARLSVFDSIMAIFENQQQSRRGGMMSPDLAYDIEKFIALEETKPESIKEAIS